LDIAGAELNHTTGTLRMTQRTLILTIVDTVPLLADIWRLADFNDIALITAIIKPVNRISDASSFFLGILGLAADIDALCIFAFLIGLAILIDGSLIAAIVKPIDDIADASLLFLGIFGLAAMIDAFIDFTGLRGLTNLEY
jgi:hypothetical protein